MKAISRPYQSDEDFWRMREFLREVFLLNQRLERSWHVARLDYARWHTCLNCARVGLEQVAFLWEAGDQLVGFVMPDGGPGEAHFCLHPEMRTPELVEEMLLVAEANLKVIGEDGARRLSVWVPEADPQLQGLVHENGYQKGGPPETQWRGDLESPLPAAAVPAGYTIRPLGDGLELLERCFASGLAFHDGDITTAVENRDDSSWYRNIQAAPLYRRDLDLVAVTGEGAIAGFCTIWFDDVTRSACFEPVAVVPAHQRRGVGKALLIEGLHRLQRMGATRAFVSGYSQAANALYSSVMGPDHENCEEWVKQWQG